MGLSRDTAVRRGRTGRLPLTADMLREEPSGNLFGMTQNVAMGWNPTRLGATTIAS